MSATSSGGGGGGGNGGGGTSGGGGGSVSEGSDAGESSQSTLSITDSPSTSFQANPENVTKINLAEESDSNPRGDMTGSKVNLTLDEKQQTDGVVNLGFDYEESANRGDGDFKSINGSEKKDKIPEAVNLELVNMVPYSNGNGTSYGVPVNGIPGIPSKKDSEAADMSSPYDEYFVPVNEHKKYMRGEKLYVTKDKRRSNSWRRCLSWIVACTVLSVILIVAILAGTGVILSQEPNMVKEASVGRNFGGTDLKPVVTGETLDDVASGHTTNESEISPETNMTYTYVPRSIESELIIDNLKWSPSFLDINSTEYQEFTTILENQLKMILFSNETLEFGESNVGLNIVNISSEPLKVLYRIGWNYKSDVQNPAEPIAMEDVKKRLVESLTRNQGYIDKYHIDMQEIKVGRVTDTCQINNGGCSHICYYNYRNQQFACTCPTNLVLDRNLKACIEWSDSSEEDYASVPNRNNYSEELDESVDLEHGNFDDDHESHTHHEHSSSTTSPNVDPNVVGSTSQSDKLDQDQHHHQGDLYHQDHHHHHHHHEDDTHGEGDQDHDHYHGKDNQDYTHRHGDNNQDDNHHHNNEDDSHNHNAHDDNHEQDHNYHSGDDQGVKSFSKPISDLSSEPTQAPNPEIPSKLTPESSLETATEPAVGPAGQSESESTTKPAPESAVEPVSEHAPESAEESDGKSASESTSKSLHKSDFESDTEHTPKSTYESVSEHDSESAAEGVFRSAQDSESAPELSSEHTSGSVHELVPESTREPFHESTSESTIEPTHELATEFTSEPTHESASESTSEFTHESVSKSTSEPTHESASESTSELTHESATELPYRHASGSAFEGADEPASESTTESTPITNISTEHEEIVQHTPSDVAGFHRNDMPELVTNSIKNSENISPTASFDHESPANVTPDINSETKDFVQNHNIITTTDSEAGSRFESSTEYTSQTSLEESSKHDSEMLPHNDSYVPSTSEPEYATTMLLPNSNMEHSRTDLSETMEDHTLQSGRANQDFNKESAIYQTEQPKPQEPIQLEAGQIDSEQHHTPLSEAIAKHSSLNVTGELNENSQITDGSLETSEMNKTGAAVTEEIIISNSSPKPTEPTELIFEHTVMPDQADTHKKSITDLNQSTGSVSENEEIINKNVSLDEENVSSTINSIVGENNYEIGVTTTNLPVSDDHEKTHSTNKKVNNVHDESITEMPRIDNIDLHQMPNNTEFENKSSTQSRLDVENNVQVTSDLEEKVGEELRSSSQGIVSETTERIDMHSHHSTTPIHLMSEFSVDEPKPKVINRGEGQDMSTESNTIESLTNIPASVSTNSSEEPSTTDSIKKLDDGVQAEHHEIAQSEMSINPNHDGIDYSKPEVVKSEMTTIIGDDKSLSQVTEKGFPGVGTDETSKKSQTFFVDEDGFNRQKAQEPSTKHLEEFSNNIKDEGVDNEGFNTLLDNDFKTKHDYSIDEKEILNKYSNKQSFLKGDKKKLKDLGKVDKIENEKKVGDETSTSPSVTPEDFILQKHVNGDDLESSFGYQAEHTTKGLGDTTEFEMSEDEIPGFGYTDNHDITLLQTVSPGLKAETATPDGNQELTPRTEVKTRVTENKEEESKSEKEYSKFEKDYKYDKQKGARKKDLKKKVGTKDGKNVELDDTKKYYMEGIGKFDGTEKDDVSTSVVQDDVRGFAETTTNPVVENITVDTVLSESEINSTPMHGDEEDLTKFSQSKNDKTASEPELVHLQEIDNHESAYKTIAETTLQPSQASSPAKTESPETQTTYLPESEHSSSSELSAINKGRNEEMSITDLPAKGNEEATREKDTNSESLHVTDIAGRGEEKVTEISPATENKEENNRSDNIRTNETITELPFQFVENKDVISRVEPAEITPSGIPVVVQETNDTLYSNEGLLASNSSREGNSDIAEGTASNGQSAVGVIEDSKAQLFLTNASDSEQLEKSFTTSPQTIVYNTPSTAADAHSEGSGSQGGAQFRINEQAADGAEHNKSVSQISSSLPVFHYTNSTEPLTVSPTNSTVTYPGLLTSGKNDSLQDGHQTRNFNTSLYTFGNASVPVSEIFNGSTTPDGPLFFFQNYTFTTENVSSVHPTFVIEGLSGTLQDGHNEIFRGAGETFVTTPGDFNTTDFGNITVYKIENGTLPDTVYDGRFNPQEGHFHMFSNSSGTFTYSSTPPNFVIRGESGDFGRSTIYILGNKSRVNDNSSGSQRPPQLIFRNATIFAIRNLTDNELSTTPEQQEAILSPNNLESLTQKITSNSFASGYISKCASGQFQCINGTSKRGSACISLSSKCDSINDCSDGSDEAGCIENGCLDNFQCADGTCLKRHLVCNGMVDCSDGSDEKQCKTWNCEFDEFRCPSGRCIPIVWQCDSKADCDNHTDEQNCQQSCGNDEYLCPEGWCIPLTYKCNGIKECSNGEDELLCDCSIDEFKCQSGGCVPKNQVCNGLDDCPDRSDEWNCVKLEPNSGLLQIRTSSGEYEPVCADNWSPARSDEVCASLGYSSSSPVDTGSTTSITNEKSFYVLKNETTADNKSNYLVNLVRTNGTCSSQKLIEISCHEFSCGSRSMTGGSSAEARLVEGMSATAGQWPSVVLLYNIRNLHSCTASVLTPRWVLASYNCLKMGYRNLNQQDWKLFGGSTVFETEKENGETRKIAAIIPHPQVKFNQFLFSNDLALVKLDEPLPFSSTIGAVCLPEQEIQPVQICVTAGWGMDTPQDKNIRQQLQYLPVPTMNLTDCNSTEHYSGFITNDKICAGYNAAEKSLCYNEEGAPLMCVNERGEWELHGVLSYHSNCGRGSHPSIFSNITPVRDWIKQTIGNSFERKITPAAKR